MSTSTSTPRRGRPPLHWLTADQTAALPDGTVVTAETTGRHTTRIVGRVMGRSTSALQLRTATGDLTVPRRDIARARISERLYEPGDAVVRRDTDAADWRGGIVDTDGEQVLVEQSDGSFTWLHETELEPAEARDAPPPPLTRGPVPARVS